MRAVVPKFVFATALATLAVLSAGTARAKRTGPAAVAPVEVGDVRPGRHAFANASGQNGGCVELRDKRSGALRRQVRVYSVQYTSGMETDVEDVFITAVSVAGSEVRVTDELHRTYVLAL
jgi:hypothetical protein